jgi:hypothetical protein
MALRLFLLALVALMSFELPSGQDFRSWSDGGSRWVDARMADLSQIRTEVEQAFSRLSPTESALTPDSLSVEIAQIRADVAFETAMDGLASAFRADLASIEARLPIAEEAPVDVVTVKNTAKVTDPACFDPELEVNPPATIITTNEVSSTQADRLTSAVRLTRQALSAWASLIDANPEATR